MSRSGKLLTNFFVAILIGGGVLLAQQRGWLDRFLPGKSTTTALTETNKSLVEPHPDAIALQDSFAQVAEAVKPAVVNISAVQIRRVEASPQEFFYGDPNEFFERYFYGEPSRPSRPRTREFRSEGTGSGVIIDPDGFILTNNHVVQGADQLTVTLSDGKSFKGKVVGTDARTDLAVVRIKSLTKFPYIPMGDSSTSRIGDWVLAVGSPFGLEQTVTAGIISAIRQSLAIEGRSFRNLLQTDAAINRGNSGGPLVNIRGQLVGINTAIYAPTGVFSGIGFAIPVNDAKSVLKELIEKGYVERSWMGVEIAPIDDVIAQQFGLNSTEGALVNQVIKDSPAAKAGLQRGDIIVEFNGKKTVSVQQLQDVVSDTPPNQNVKVKVLREGDFKTLNLKTAQLPKQPSEEAESQGEAQEEPTSATEEWLGAKVGELTSRVRGQYGIDDPSIKGVVIVEIPTRSVASEAGLMEGDVIQSINRTPVDGLSDLKKVKVDVKKGFVLDVIRRGRSFYLSYKPLQ